MREAAETCSRKPGSSRGSAASTAERQAWVADMADAGVFGERDAARGDWRREADRVLNALKARS